MASCALRVARCAFAFGRAVDRDWQGTAPDRASDPLRPLGEAATRNAQRATRNPETA